MCVGESERERESDGSAADGFYLKRIGINIIIIINNNNIIISDLIWIINNDNVQILNWIQIYFLSIKDGFE